MYWLNVKSLERDLRTGRLSEYDRFCYVLALFMFAHVIILLGRYVEVSFSFLDLGASLLDLCIYATGITWAYRINAVGDNTDFVGRLIPLFCVIFLRVMLSVVLLYILATLSVWLFLHISLIHMAQRPTFLFKLCELAIVLSGSLWLWTWIYCAIKRVSA